MNAVASLTKPMPTIEQIDDAVEYIAESGLNRIFVAVWRGEQECEPVMDRGLPAIWTDRNSALTAFGTGRCGQAMFTVNFEGHVHLMWEAS